MDIQFLIDNPVKFTPPNGTEWPEVPQWTDEEWTHWLAEHNKYQGLLKTWSPEEIHQYLDVDRWKYGVGFKRTAREDMTWFYNPVPMAVPFHALNQIANLLFGGAVGGTKSHSARWDAIRRATVLPNFMGLIMRRTHVELKDNHMTHLKSESETLNAFFDKKILALDEGDHECRMNFHGPGKEGKIVLGHCQNVGDELKYLGNAYDVVYPDEMATFEKQQITGIQARLRAVQIGIRRGKPCLIRGTSNPGGAKTLWLKDYYIDRNTEKIWEENPRYVPGDYHFLQSMLYDNPYYMDPDGTYTMYENRLFEHDAERRVQLLLGDWSVLTGQFFPEFAAVTHVTRDIIIPPGCRIERWIDWGYDPHYGMCLWVALLPSGRIYVFYEWKFNGASAKIKLVASEVAKRIKELTHDEVYKMVTQTNRISKSVADPSMWGSSGHTGEDYAETFRKNGVHCTQADNDRVLGWGRLRHWLRNAPDGYPWLMIHPRCEVTARTLPTLIRDKNDSDDLDTTGEDHPADTLRYGVMARPSPWKMSRGDTIVIPGTAGAMAQEILHPRTGRGNGLVA